MLLSAYKKIDEYQNHYQIKDGIFAQDVNQTLLTSLQSCFLQNKEIVQSYDQNGFQILIIQCVT